MALILLQSLILASAGILSVGSITIVILLLISDRGWHNGLGYAFGYTSAYTVIGLSVVTLGYRVAENKTGKPSIVLPIIMIILGSLLLWLSLKNWRKPAPENKKEPRLFSVINKITPLKAFGFGALVSMMNFKNLALFLSALSVVILSNLLITEKIIVTLFVVLVFCLSVIIPVLIYVIFPKKANYLLNRIKETLEKNNRLIGIWLPFLFGLIFLLKGISGLL